MAATLADGAAAAPPAPENGSADIVAVPVVEVTEHLQHADLNTEAKDGKRAEKEKPWRSEEDPLLFYVWRTGFNDIAIYEGADKPKKKDVPVYYIDVASKLGGWNMVVLEGPDAKTGRPLLHIKKPFLKQELLGVDKGTGVSIKHHADSDVARQSAEAAAAAAAADDVQEDAETGPKEVVISTMTAGNDGIPQIDIDDSPDSELLDGSAAETQSSDISTPKYSEETAATDGAKAEAAPSADDGQEAGQKKGWLKSLTGKLHPKEWIKPAPNVEASNDDLAMMTRKMHGLKNNKNEFMIEGVPHEWDYTPWIGATLTCVNLQTNEEVAVCRLKPKHKHIISTQLITDWGLRIDGPLEVRGSGRAHLPILLATLAAMLEWRKHNNKVWIISLAII